MITAADTSRPLASVSTPFARSWIWLDGATAAAPAVLRCCRWIFNLAWSPWWLRRYFFGPLEWCWRSLTYWRGRLPSGRNRTCDFQRGHH